MMIIPQKNGKEQILSLYLTIRLKYASVPESELTGSGARCRPQDGGQYGMAALRGQENLSKMLNRLSIFNLHIEPLFSIFSFMDIKDIAKLCDARMLRWTSHILDRIFRQSGREITGKGGNHDLFYVQRDGAGWTIRFYRQSG